MDGTRWRAVTAAAAVVTIASAIFAVGAAVSSSDDSGDATPAAGTSGGTAAAGAGVAVSISEFAFDPAQLTVAAGSTITFTNDDNVPHTVRSADGALASPELASGATYSVTVSEPAEIEYICTIHDFMRGSVTVTP